MGNLAIQLRSAAEFGAALRTLEGETLPQYLLVDTTFSLPLVANAANSLFYEHLKRLCCVRARSEGVGFFALSKSHGLPAMEVLEDLARQGQGQDPGQTAEHWYLRIPELHRDGWELSLTEGRRIPPPGAVSYLVRFHRTTPVMRLDMDLGYWQTTVKGATAEETRSRERTIFEDLDYACHDQRVYGYPYPIKAAHDRASLTQAERVAFRKQLIAAALKQGMSLALFRSEDLAEELLIEMKGMVLGYAEQQPEGWTFHRPRRLPEHLSNVYRVDAHQPGTPAVMRELMGSQLGTQGLYVGDLLAGEQALPGVEVLLPPYALSHHLGVFGRTGAGKSNLMMMVLLRSVMAHNRAAAGAVKGPRASVLAIDPHDEFRLWHGATGGKDGIHGIVAGYSAQEQAELVEPFLVPTYFVSASLGKGLLPFNDEAISRLRTQLS